MIKYIIPIIIVLIVIVAIIFVFRNKHLAEMRKLQQLRDDLHQKRVQDELAKVKGLNMNGQTEELFESWKAKWENINDHEFPIIDDLLLDVEDYIGKFQFGKASNAEQEIQSRIEESDQTIQQILEELEHLLTSEKQSSVEIEQLHEQYRTSRKTLLAHQYSFGDAANPLEERLENFNPQFEAFQQLTEAGDYLKAREVVEHLNEEGQIMFKLISTIPGLLREIQKQIPSDLQELRLGHNEMEDSGFYLKHLEILEWMKEIEIDLQDLKEQISNLEVTQAELRVQEIREEIERYFDALEAEYVSRQYVDEHVSETGELLDEVLEQVLEIVEETTKVRKSYHLDDNEAGLPGNCKQELISIKQRYETLLHELELHQAAYSMVEKELKGIHEDVIRIQGEQTRFSERLKNLRIDENSAAGTVKELHHRLRETERRLHKANMPGIPSTLENRLTEAAEQLGLVEAKLQEVPLNMPAVFEAVKSAEIAVGESTKHVDSTIEDVKLIEMLIQYGNRYRLSNPSMDKNLSIAEDAFINLRFQKALEVAATAVEEAEPGALKKMDERVKETLGK